MEKKTNNTKTFSDAESLLEVILLRADMFFQYKFDAGNTFVCDTHHKKLFQQLCFYKVKSNCGTCLSVRGTPLSAKADLRHITVSQAITLFEVFKLKNSYGKLICRNCRTEVSKKTEATREKLLSDAFRCLFDPESVCCVEDSMDDKDLDYQPPFDLSSGEEKLNEQIKALNSFLSACGSKRQVNVTASYKDLSYRVKLRYVNLVKIHNAISYIFDSIE